MPGSMKAVDLREENVPLWTNVEFGTAVQIGGNGVLLRMGPDSRVLMVSMWSKAARITLIAVLGVVVISPDEERLWMRLRGNCVANANESFHVLRLNGSDIH